MSISLPLAPVPAPTVALPTRRSVPEMTRSNSVPTPVKQVFRWVWFSVLLASICFEGLGRRYLPGVPSAAFYFLKDVVLVVGLLRFRINRDVKSLFIRLYGNFAPLLKLAILWSFVEIVNPLQQSIPLGFLGFRAYWLWWLAPLVVASVLLDPVVRKKVVYLQAGITIIVSLLAIMQFGAPVDSAVNTYSMVNGAESLAIPVASTGRARVSSTFSFLTGFADFAVLVPVLLLSIGLGEKDRRARLAALMATLVAAAALPMSGSRGSFLLSLALCLMVVWRAGLFFTRTGRRMIVVAVAAGFASVFAFPDALQGVMDRFEGNDTGERLTEIFTVLPPVALIKYDGVTVLGIGTGMTQNFRGQFGVYDDPLGNVEGEVARCIFELGAPGYLVYWMAKLGLVVVLWRSSKILKRAGRRPAAAGAVAYAVLGLYGSITFDHIFAALYFVGFGFIFREVVEAQRSLQRQPVARPKALPASGPSAAEAQSIPVTVAAPAT
jgi:hypothetical protein